jgi:hypothetical protein
LEGVGNASNALNDQTREEGLEDERAHSLPRKVIATARKRIEGEAFSSSSDEDDDTDLEGIYGQGAEVGRFGAGHPIPEDMNVCEEEDEQGSNAPDQEIERVDTVPFTWTHSAGSAEEEDRINDAAHVVQGGSQSNNSEADSYKAAASIVSASMARRSQQSAFDRALIEIMQQDDNRPRSNSYSLRDATGRVDASLVADAALSPADEDYLAKAENNVLDEILSENPSDADLTNEQAGSKTGSNTDVVDNRRSSNAKVRDRVSLHTNNQSKYNSTASSDTANKLDVLSTVRQKIESFTDVTPGAKSTNNEYSYYPPTSANSSTHESIMMIDTSASTALDKYYKDEEERENMRRTFQQSISAAVLVSLAHKRYERRRLAAMEIEKVVRSLVVQEDYSRVRAILLLLSDDYVRSTNEDARKGGVVALAACAIGLKKAVEGRDVMECRDLILASVVHACQDHSQRVRYYATESLFNVTKVIPSLAVQHFFILFEILRSLYADVDLDVRSGAELLDKKLKEVIVGAINSGSFSADACVPVFARFVYMRNKATKQLTLTWLQEFSDKLIGAPILEFLHLFLGGIFAIVSDPNTTIRQLALEFLQVSQR